MNPTLLKRSAHLHGPVLIVGTGLLGASIGLGLRQRGIDVYLSDASPSAEAVATDIAAGVPLADAPADLAPELVVVGAPPDVCGSLVVAALRTYPHAVVTDVASVKTAVLEEVRVAASDDETVDVRRYLGSHPMAGRERSGAVSARAELFTSAPWVICPHDDVDPHAYRTVTSLAMDLGGIVTTMDPAAHDEAVALVSHLPQVVSSLLASRLQDTPAASLSLAGQGLRDVTRIAASDPGLWVQILGANAGHLVEPLEGMRADIERLLHTLRAPTAPGARLDMAQLISEGNAGQARIPGKHGGPAQQFAWLTVLVDDKPGQIALLLTEIGQLDVNLEDMRLGHSAGLPVGMVEIAVLPSKKQSLVEDLTGRGWKVVA